MANLGLREIGGSGFKGLGFRGLAEGLGFRVKA